MQEYKNSLTHWNYTPMHTHNTGCIFNLLSQHSSYHKRFIAHKACLYWEFMVHLSHSVEHTLLHTVCSKCYLQLINSSRTFWKISPSYKRARLEILATSPQILSFNSAQVDCPTFSLTLLIPCIMVSEVTEHKNTHLFLQETRNLSFHVWSQHFKVK